jgi:thermitase
MVGAALGILLVPAGITAADVVPNQFIVRTSDSQALAEFAAEHGLETAGLIIYSNPSAQTMALFGNFYVLTFPKESGTTAEQLTMLAQPWVEQAEPNALLYPIPGYDKEVVESFTPPPDTFDDPYTPNDPMFGDQWDKTLTETDWAWNSTRGEGATVAVLDQGVDTTHEDLNENLYRCYNSVDNDSNYHDLRGHGTSCCGYAAARIDNNVGIAGMAGGAHLMAIRVFPDEGGAPSSVIINAINYAVDNGANVISMSFGAYGNVGLEWTLNSAWDRGVFSCAGAGNNNKDEAFYPAAYPKVMGVGATTSDDERWENSNYGINAQIYSPGGLTTKPGNTYGSGTATSFTTPQVAGLAALVYSAYPGTATQQVWDNIIETADTLDSDIGKILRINSRNAVFREIIIGVDEESAEPVLVKASPIQHGAIRFAAPGAANYRLDVYDVSGSLVYRDAGRTDADGEITCNPAIGQGVYFWEIRTHHSRETGKFVYVK